MTAIDLMLLTGEWLLYILAFILCVRPLVKHDKRFSPLFKYRKQMGWLFGAFTAAHVAIYLFLYIEHFNFLLTLFDDVWFITGLIATVLTLALTATSNRWAQRKLKAKWKTLHKATYWIGFLGILHGELASKQENITLYVMLLILSLLILYRYRKVWALSVVLSSTLLLFFMMQTPNTASPTLNEPVEGSIEWERCGQYGLNYYEAPNGFYNCTVRGK